ncbi:hypothetical protein [Terrisporobacter hibernicus]|uniref:Uncharacterized protein n=1 Tax=Terrisporobacter hibernicus TaxID=2813371 RepID=A0AAX2ZIY5_9FIRM|nr:hypothetical protein [Terrisporobacter hibernicus]UEL49183.1 hypothetical protein JW646_06985 [Terrisporobacter hibernicus]
MKKKAGISLLVLLVCMVCEFYLAFSSNEPSGLQTFLFIVLLIPILVSVYNILSFQIHHPKGIIITEVVAVIIFGSLYLTNIVMTRSDNIESVKNATLYGLEGMTIGEAFSNGISNGEWSNGKKQEVIYIATSVDDQSNKCIIKFNVKDTGEIFISSVSLNDKNKNGYDLYSTIVGIYENAKYKSSNGFSRLYENYLVSGRISTHKDDNYQENSAQESTDVPEDSSVEETESSLNSTLSEDDREIAIDTVMQSTFFEGGLTYDQIILGGSDYTDYSYDVSDDCREVTLTTTGNDKMDYYFTILKDNVVELRFVDKNGITIGDSEAIELMKKYMKNYTNN